MRLAQLSRQIPKCDILLSDEDLDGRISMLESTGEELSTYGESDFADRDVLPGDANSILLEPPSRQKNCHTSWRYHYRPPNS